MKEHINLTIPTIGRFRSLFDTIQSFYNQPAPANTIVGVTVVVDWNRREYHDKIKAAREVTGIPFDLKFNDRRLGWNRSLNRVFAETDYDYYINGSDDLAFKRNFLVNLYATMTTRFPDGDGVVGITQNLGKFCPAAFAMIGRKFVNRFRDRAVMCPHYQHFCGDSELWRYSQHLSRFVLCGSAKVRHDRPMDEGKRLANASLWSDRDLWWRKLGHPERYWGNAYFTPAQLKKFPPARKRR